MKKVALHEVVTINPRASQISLLPTDLVSFVPMAAVSELSRNIEEVEVRQYSEVSKGYTYFEEGDVIVAKITPCYENGKIALARDLPHRVAFGSTEFHVFRASDAIANKYIFHLLQAPAVRTAGAAQMKGAAGQKRVPADYFKALEIPLPPLAEQKRIAAILDAADAMRVKRRETLALLDTLLQSTFLDMFGDPVTNSKGWKVVAIEGVLDVKGGFAFKSSDYLENSIGAPLIRIGEVNRCDFDSKKLVQLPLSYFDKFERFVVKNGAILMSLTGTVGKNDYGNAITLRGDADRYLLNQRVAELIPSSKLNSSYLHRFLSQEKVKNNLTDRSRGVRQANISNGDIKQLQIPLPPLNLQRRFATITESVQQQKAHMRAHLAELDTLFASLQSRAFNGEL